MKFSNFRKKRKKKKERNKHDNRQKVSQEIPNREFSSSSQDSRKLERREEEESRAKLARDGYFNNVIIRRRDWCWTIRWQRNGSLKERHRETSRSKGCRLRVINILTTVHRAFPQFSAELPFFPGDKIKRADFCRAKVPVCICPPLLSPPLEPINSITTTLLSYNIHACIYYDAKYVTKDGSRLDLLQDEKFHAIFSWITRDN